MTRLELTIFADYFQFYVQDAAASLPDGLWKQDAVARMLDAGPGVVGVGTARNDTVPVVVEVAAGEVDDDGAQLVTEASLDITTGRVAVLGAADYAPDAKGFELANGTYRARAFYHGLDTISADGFDGADRYRIVLWPSPDRVPPRVVRDRRERPRRRTM